MFMTMLPVATLLFSVAKKPPALVRLVYVSAVPTLYEPVNAWANFEQHNLVQPDTKSARGNDLMAHDPASRWVEPTQAQRLGWLLKDNRGVLIALAGLILLLVFCVYEWRRVGRDPRKDIIIARYEPPAGQSPASLRYLRRMGYDARCFSSGVLALAVSGCLRIVREKRLFKDEWQLEPNPASAAPADAGQGVLIGLELVTPAVDLGAEALGDAVLGGIGVIDRDLERTGIEMTEDGLDKGRDGVGAEVG